jgi:hypothetical protein
MLAKEIYVFSHSDRQFSLQKSSHIGEILYFLFTNKEVEVFESCASFGKTRDWPINCAAFQIENVLEIVWVLKLESVLHDHHVNFVDVVRLNCEHTKYFSQQRVLVFLEMLNIVGKKSHKKM